MKANSQKVALKLIFMSRKVRNMLGVLSLEDVTRVTGLNVKRIDMILKKSDQVEQKLVEGESLLGEYQYNLMLGLFILIL